MTLILRWAPVGLSPCRGGHRQETGDLFPVAFLLLAVGCAFVFGVGGAAVGSIAASLLGEVVRASAWVALDVVLVVSVCRIWSTSSSIRRSTKGLLLLC